MGLWGSGSACAYRSCCCLDLNAVCCSEVNDAAMKGSSRVLLPTPMLLVAVLRVLLRWSHAGLLLACNSLQGRDCSQSTSWSRRERESKRFATSRALPIRHRRTPPTTHREGWLRPIILHREFHVLKRTVTYRWYIVHALQLRLVCARRGLHTDHVTLPALTRRGAVRATWDIHPALKRPSD